MADEVVIRDRKDHENGRSMITSLRIKKNPRHWHITVWNRGGQAGILTVDAADGPAITNMLIPPNRQSERSDP